MVVEPAAVTIAVGLHSISGAISGLAVAILCAAVMRAVFNK